ncbi:hypothetical protein K469DRAFT_618268, partial [Zopfia rhizophila CBS 207.26]
MKSLLRPSWPKQTLSLLCARSAVEAIGLDSRHTPLHRTLHRGIATSTAISTPSQPPKLIISPGSVHHNSLPSFLEYAKRVNLSPTKTVYVGTHYEYTVALSLLRLGFSLLRTGRRSDAGIDLIGHWSLPTFPEPLPVIVQCKARTCSLYPQHVRELEGAFQGIPAEWRKRDVMGLLVTTHKATKGVLETLGMNRWPMGFVKISRTGTVEQFIWNRSAGERGLEGVGVTVRHTPMALVVGKRNVLPEAQYEQGEEGSGWSVEEKDDSRKRKAVRWRNTGTKKDIQLTWMGQPIFLDREELDEETKRLGEGIAVVEDQEEPAEPRKDANRSGTAKRRGRPKGSRNKMVASAEAVIPARRRGRPKGSKNK